MRKPKLSIKIKLSSFCLEARDSFQNSSIELLYTEIDLVKNIYISPSFSLTKIFSIGKQRVVLKGASFHFWQKIYLLPVNYLLKLCNLRIVYD